jgi:hypothetical protein
MPSDYESGDGVETINKARKQQRKKMAAWPTLNPGVKLSGKPKKKKKKKKKSRDDLAVVGDAPRSFVNNVVEVGVTTLDQTNTRTRTKWRPI